MLLALAYAIGPISGCHINPAVTLGVLLAKGMTATEAGLLLGRPVRRRHRRGGASSSCMTSGFGGVTDQTGNLGSNNWGATHQPAAARSSSRSLLTFVFVARDPAGHRPRRPRPGFAGLAIGLTLTAVHLVGIPLDGTSVNPARSLGPALFAGGERARARLAVHRRAR